jgi:hypothetical protein
VILIAFLFVFAVYLLVFYGFARLVRRVFEKRGKHLAGRVMVWLIMFSSIAVVFWDAVPTWINHRRLCETESGVKVYMTSDEWKKYPDRYLHVQSVTNSMSREVVSNDRVKTSIRRLNSDFNLVVEDEINYGLGVTRERIRLVDSKTGDVLYERVDFAGGVSGGSVAIGANSLSDYKFWLKTNGCGSLGADLYKNIDADKELAGATFKAVSNWGEK